MALCTVEHLSFTYSGQTKEVLHQLDLEIEEGEFIVLCGQSGCGKTTLLRHLKPELRPFGKTSGKICFEGSDVQTFDAQESASSIGYVMQNPDNQIVTDKVWHEMAFGLENLGVPNTIMRRRVAEMATFFGIEHLFHRESDTLSGGQKQMLNLASIMLMQPKLLLLDEPTSQLDPIAASEFLETLKRINDDFGTTIVLIEHRLEEVFKLADRIIVMEKGTIICSSDARNILANMNKINPKHPMLEGFPTPMRLYEACPHDSLCPISVKEAKRYVKQYFHPSNQTISKTYPTGGQVIVDVKQVYFRYQKEGRDILKGVNLQVYEQDICMLLGSNGAGKSTLLNMITGQYHPYRGSLTLFGRKIQRGHRHTMLSDIAYIPQNPTTLFLKDTVREDLYAMYKAMGNSPEVRERLEYYIELLDIADILPQHPYDLSGGEQQKVALCKVLLKQPKLLLLDEPTKGLDAFAKITLANILQELQREGMTILMVSHDIEFGASYATRCALLFDGDVISQDDPQSFFAGNSFYTTAANKICKGFYAHAVTCEDVIQLCQQHQK